MDECESKYSERIIETITIDDLRQKDVVSYIKMDIEGVEVQVLSGAKKVILKNHLKLAISIYYEEQICMRSFAGF